MPTLLEGSELLETTAFEEVAEASLEVFPPEE